MRNLIDQLEELALASRMRRLSERLMKDVAQIYAEQDVEFKPRWFPVLYCLHDRGSMSVTGLAEALDLTHAAINQIVGEMGRHRLVNQRRDRRDERRRLASLSAAGRRLVPALEPIWDGVRRANAELVVDSGGDLLGCLAAVERQLAEASMYDRVRRYVDGPQPVPEILDYRPAYKKHFAALNRAWLEECFEVEDDDARLLADPNRLIIRKGGRILFLRLRDEIVGTCALLRRDADQIELAKMVIRTDRRGQGLGRILARAAIDRAREMGARRVVLATSPQLEAAGALYAELGFRREEELPAWAVGYKRPTVVLFLDL